MHVPQVPDSSRVRFRCRARTRWSDEDNQNVLNNAVYMTLLEEARHAYFGKLGLLEGWHFPFLHSMGGLAMALQNSDCATQHLLDGWHENFSEKKVVLHCGCPWPGQSASAEHSLHSSTQDRKSVV